MPARRTPTDYTRLHEICAMMNPDPQTKDHVNSATVAATVRAYLMDMLERPALRGELNANGTVSGLHLWSELYLAEREGRANYRCTVEGVDDPDVMSIRYDWRAPGRLAFSSKSIGSLHLGMSPACLLALGYYAIEEGIEGRPGAQVSFTTSIYGQSVGFALGVDNGAIVTLFPIADPR